MSMKDTPITIHVANGCCSRIQVIDNILYFIKTNASLSRIFTA